MATKDVSAKPSVRNTTKAGRQETTGRDVSADDLFKSESCYTLWEILQGTSVVQDLEHISLELKQNQNKLVKGITYFKKPSVSSKDKLEKETRVKPLRREFILKLSKFLDLDEWQSLELFHNYLQNSFRGSREQLQNVFTNEIHTETLLIKVMEYYFEERIFILNSLETILGHWQTASHPFQEPFDVFVNEVMRNDDLISKLWSQYKECCKSSVHIAKENEHDMSKRHSHRFAQQRLREQIAVLRLIFFLHKDFQQPASSLLEAVKLFQAQSFGLRQVNRHVFDGFTELLVTQIGFIQAMVLVEAMDLGNLIEYVADESSFEKHPIVKDKAVIKELDTILSKWGDLIHHGPVILAWTVLRFLVLETAQENTQDLRRMGTKALMCNVFPYLLNLMKSEPFASDTIFSNSIKGVVYTLLSVVLTIFHENTLGDPQILIAVLKETLASQDLCQMFWDSEINSGMAMLLKSAKNKFPFRFAPFVQIMTSLARDEQTSENVFKYLDSIDSYTEPSNVNSLEDVDCTDSDETLWKLINAKILYKNVVSTADKIVIPSGSLGKVYMSNEGLHLLRWSFNYSCWQLFLLELDSFLQQTQHMSTHEVQHAVAKVIDIIELLNNVLKYNWDKIQSLVMLVDRVYYILQRFSPNANSPSQLISSCVKCLTTVTAQEPVQSWISFQQTGFLPFCISSLQPTQKVILISSVSVDPGSFGNLLTSHERSQGTYVITLATLDLLSELVAIISPSAERPVSVPGIQDFIACLVYLCRDVFNGFHKWHYNDLKEKQEIGLKCLEIFHKILAMKDSGEDQIFFSQTFDVSVSHEQEEISNATKVCEMLVEALLWTDVGQSLLHVVGIGMAFIDKLFAVHGSCSDSPAQLVVKLIKSALKVLNEVLDRKPQCSEQHDLTPLEQTLISHVSKKLGSDAPEGVHLVSIISSYLYYRQDNELGAVAMELLRKIAIISPMSMYGSLGARAKSLRDAFAIRLTSITEDVHLKVAILDFLSSAVETQPALMELFLDFNTTQHPAAAADEGKEVKMGSNSCIKPVLACITKKASSPVHPSVLAASFKFLYALWKNGREMAMITVKKSEKLWENLSQHLLRDLPNDAEEDFICYLQICSFAFQIIAQELHYIKRGKVDVSLKNILEEFEAKQRFQYWSKQVTKVTALSSNQHGSCDTIEYSLNFLRSWRSFLIVLADSEVSSMCCADDDLKMLLLENAVECIKDQFNEEVSSRVLRIAVEKSSLFLMMLRKWITSVHSSARLVDLIAVVLQAADNADPVLLAHVRIPLMTSLSLLLQYMREERIVEDLETGSITSILPLICGPLQYNIDVQDTKEIQRQNKVLSVTLCLLNEVVTCVAQPIKWIEIFSEHALFANLVQMLDRNLRKKENIDVVEAVLHLILSLSKYTEASQALTLNLIVQPLCLGMAALHQKLTKTDRPHVTCLENENTTAASRWEDVWGLGLTVASSLLGKLRYEFLKESLDFVGVHRERIVHAMDVVRINQTPSCLREAEHITMFLVKLSLYRKEWQLALPDVLQIVLSSTTMLLETCVSLLIHPRLLAYLIEKPSYHSAADKSDSSSCASGPTLSRTMSSTSELLRPYSTPDEPLEKQNPKVIDAQKRLLKVVCNVLGVLKNFSPNICEMLLDEGMDIDEYVPLFGVEFKTPVLDSDSSPSFGCLVSCLNVCLGHVHVAYPRPSASPDKSPWKFTALSSTLPKSTVNFAMENAVILIMSQAFLYLKDSRVEPATKEPLKRRLNSELEPFLSGIVNHFERRGCSSSPGSTPTTTSPSSSARSFGRARSEPGEQKDVKIFQLVSLLLKSMKSEAKEGRW